GGGYRARWLNYTATGCSSWCGRRGHYGPPGTRHSSREQRGRLIPPSPSKLAYLDQLGDEQDRMMFEYKQWQAEREVESAPLRKSGPEAIMYRVHDNNAPAPAAEPDAAPSEGVMAPHDDYLSDATIECIADGLLAAERDRRGEMQKALMRRDRRLSELEGELKELKGFVKGLLAVLVPKDKTADIVMLPDRKGTHGT